MVSERQTVSLLKIVFVGVVGALLVATTMAGAAIELSPLAKMELGVQPVDVAISEDGKIVFVLTGNEVLACSVPEKKTVTRINLHGTFDRIWFSDKADLLILTGTKTGAVKIIKVAHVFSIDTSGHPFKGLEKALVTIAVFDDYQ